MYEPLPETTGTKTIEAEVFTYHDSSVFRKQMKIKTNEYVPSCGFLEAANICLNA